MKKIKLNDLRLGDVYYREQHNGVVMHISGGHGSRKPSYIVLKSEVGRPGEYLTMSPPIPEEVVYLGNIQGNLQALGMKLLELIEKEKSHV